MKSVKKVVKKYWFFPALFVYLELFFRIYMHLDLKFFPVFILFGVFFGIFFAFISRLFSPKVNKIVSCTMTFIICLLYAVEMMCKIILATYFPLFSVASTAANNHLTDYKATVLNSIGRNILGLLLVFLPFILHFLYLKYMASIKKSRTAEKLHLILYFIGAYILAWFFMHFSYGALISPIDLYHTDMEIEAQVNELGVFTMIKQDLFHSVFGVSYDSTIKKDELDKMNQDFNFGVTTTPVPTSGAAEPDATPTPTPKPVDTSPNVLNIDFSKVEGNDSVQWLNSYFESVEPTKKNEYTGMFEGYNVIFITAEGFDGYVVDKDRTPTLYKLVNTGFVFNNFYNTNHYASTTNGECQNLLGLYPKNGEPQTLTDVGDSGLSMPFTLANLLNKQGYTSNGYHLNYNMYNRAKSHPLLGYTWHDANDSMMVLDRVESGGAIWPQSDVTLVNDTFDHFTSTDKFNVYYMTISGHLGYKFDENYIAWRNRDRVSNLSYGETTRGYIACQLELEDALTLLLQKLEEKNLLDNTLIVLGPDHIPYCNMEVIEELSGLTFGRAESNGYINESTTNLEVYKSALIIWSASMEEPVQVDKVCDSVDILPTVCNLMGLEYDSRVIAGRDILDSSDSGFVISSSHCWWSDYGFYNVHSGVFTAKEGVTMTEDEKKAYIDAMNLKANYTLKITSMIQETNYYAKLSW